MAFFTIMDQYHEISDSALWSISSFKAGFGVAQLRQKDSNTYWQTDGPQPHKLNLQWYFSNNYRAKRMNISNISIYVDYKLDESYTPSKIVVKAGGCGTFQPVQTFTVNEPSGWLDIKLDAPIRTFHLQICVVQNHQNGKDTHIRQVKIFSPLESAEYEQ
jgi:anaphase-promoting complex subunit 10